MFGGGCQEVWHVLVDHHLVGFGFEFLIFGPGFMPYKGTSPIRKRHPHRNPLEL